MVGCSSDWQLSLPSLTLPKCFNFPKHGLYGWACPARDTLVKLTLATDAVMPDVFFPKISALFVHSLCICAFFAIFVWLDRSSDIWKNEAFEQGQLPYLLYLFNSIKTIGKAPFCVLKVFSSSTVDRLRDQQTSLSANTYWDAWWILIVYS